MYGDLFGGNAMSSEALCRSLALSRLVRGEEDVAAHVLEERCMDRCDSKVGAESQGYVVPLQCAGLVAGLKRKVGVNPSAGIAFKSHILK